MNITAAAIVITKLNPLKNLVKEITVHPLEGNIFFKNTNQPKEILNIISKFLSCTSLVAAKKLRSRVIKVTVTNKDYIIKNKKSL